MENIMAEENKSHRASAPADEQNKFESSKMHARKAAEELRDAAGAVAGEYRGKAEQAWNDARGKAEHAWTDARGKAEHALNDARTRARTFQDDAEQYVRENPTKDRKSTRLNSSHRCISYAVFCLKKKNTRYTPSRITRSKTSS